MIHLSDGESNFSFLPLRESGALASKNSFIHSRLHSINHADLPRIGSRFVHRRRGRRFCEKYASLFPAPSRIADKTPLTSLRYRASLAPTVFADTDQILLGKKNLTPLMDMRVASSPDPLTSSLQHCAIFGVFL